jgi:hypothetical protein
MPESGAQENGRFRGKRTKEREIPVGATGDEARRKTMWLRSDRSDEDGRSPP